ncbi:MAG: sigma-54-dependent transcriptional regulator [Planctomycetota bacterium]|jgi:two-component system nitrogen regulation response regulator NtrX
MKRSVLVIDDEEAIRSSLRMILEYEGVQTLEASDGPSGLETALREEPDLVLLDIKMPHMDGMGVLQELRRRQFPSPIIMVSGHGTVSTAVEAIKLGAFDFLEKPLERDRVLLTMRNALEHRDLSNKVEGLKQEVEARYQLIGESLPMRQLRDAIARTAPSMATVLITGESGTGKELVARAIHRASSRAHEAFIKVNCAAIPEDLIESEMFGHERGAFTGASQKQIGKFVRADGGTIFLDEIGDMSPRVQAKVLRVLQDGEVEPVGAGKQIHVDVRVIAATNYDLETAISKGRFREDLYFRLNVLPIHCPPLRERPDDVPPLVDHFVQTYIRESASPQRRFSVEALEQLRELPWKGNVRELKNSVERALILSEREEITPEDLRAVPAGSAASSAALASRATSGEPASSASASAEPSSDRATATSEGGRTLKEFKEGAERAFPVRMLRENDWNITQTARLIDTPRSNLYKKIEQYGISREHDDA